MVKAEILREKRYFSRSSRRAGLGARGMHHVTLSATVTNGNLLWMIRCKIIELGCKHSQVTLFSARVSRCLLFSCITDPLCLCVFVLIPDFSRQLSFISSNGKKRNPSPANLG